MLPADRLPLAAKVKLTVVVALVVLAATTVLAMHEVHGAGGAIEVLDTQEQVDFPNGVGLAITAESDTDIVEVRVYFRASGSRNWGYAYADFNAGSKIVATRSLPVDETAYIAPGVELEYYYQIKDAHGSVLKTERFKVEYLDDRYDWKRINIGPLELIYHDVSDRQAGGVARQLQQDLQVVTDLLQLEPKETFKGVVYNSYSDANAVFPKQSQTTTDQGTFAGYAFPEQGVFVGQGLDRRIIVHESAHMLMREAVGEDALDVPSWLDEGFASYVEPNARVRDSRELREGTLPLRGMNNVSGTPRTIRLFYQKSLSVFAFLIEEYGRDNFRRLLDVLADGETVEDALLEVYGFDVDGLDDRWAGLPVAPAANESEAPQASTQPAPDDRPPRESPPLREPMTATEEGSSAQDSSRLATPLPRQPAQSRETGGDGPSPFLYFDVWVLAGVAILVAMIVGTRSVYARIRKKRVAGEETDDGLIDSDWEYR